MAILNSVSGAFLSTGFDPHATVDATLRHFQTALDVLMLLVLFPPPLVYLWYMTYRSVGQQRHTAMGLEDVCLEEDEEQADGRSEIEHLRGLLAETQEEKQQMQYEKEQWVREKQGLEEQKALLEEQLGSS